MSEQEKLEVALQCLEMLVKEYSKSFYDADELRAVGNAKIGEIINKAKATDEKGFKGFVCISLVNAFRNCIRNEKRKCIFYKKIKNKRDVSLFIDDDEKKIKLNEVYIVMNKDKNISIEIVNKDGIFRLKTLCTIDDFKQYYENKKNRRK